jgi:hypothetical protein
VVGSVVVGLEVALADPVPSVSLPPSVSVPVSLVGDVVDIVVVAVMVTTDPVEPAESLPLPPPLSPHAAATRDAQPPITQMLVFAMEPLD